MNKDVLFILLAIFFSIAATGNKAKPESRLMVQSCLFQKYKQCFDTIILDKKIHKGFVFLSNTHKTDADYFKKKILINDWMIERTEVEVCEEFDINDMCKDKLSNLNKLKGNPKFELFFSKYCDNSIECFIVNYDKNLTGRFRFRFGKRMKLTFYFNDEKLSKISMELSLVG